MDNKITLLAKRFIADGTNETVDELLMEQQVAFQRPWPREQLVADRARILKYIIYKPMHIVLKLIKLTAGLPSGA